MSEQNDARRDSRMEGQPAPKPVGPPASGGERPSYDELMAQARAADYSEVAEHLDDDARAALGLPAAPAGVEVDRELAGRIRRYYLERPEKAAELPDTVRAALTL